MIVGFGGRIYPWWQGKKNSTLQILHFLCWKIYVCIDEGCEAIKIADGG